MRRLLILWALALLWAVPASAQVTPIIYPAILPTGCADTEGIVWSASVGRWTCGAVGGSGAVGTDAIWDAAGDLAVGSGANTAVRLAIGTANQLLRVNAGATAVEYASTLSGLTFVAPVLGAATATTLDTGFGANELYDMDQHVLTTSNVQFAILTITAAAVFPDNVTQVFNPGATVAGLDVGSLAGDPSTPTNGMMWYDSTANELTARINGANVALGAGGAGAPTDATYITQTAHGSLSAEQALGTLATGCMSSTTTTGVVATRTLTGTANEIGVTGGDCSANPTFSIPATFSLAAKTSFNLPDGAAPVVDAAGELAHDNNYGAASNGLLTFYNGSAASMVVSFLAADTPVAGDIPVWSASGYFTLEAAVTVPIVDTQTIIKGSADATKLLRFEVDGFTTATTRVITPPNSDTTLPIISQVVTISGPTAARTYTFPDASTTVLTTNADVTYAQITAAAGASRLLGRGDSGAGDWQEVTLGSGLSMTGTVLSASGGGLPAVDTTSIVEGSGDGTKEVRIEADGITTGTVRVWTAPDSNTTIPIFSQIITFAGPTAARTYTFPDAAATIARTDAGQTFTGANTFTSPTIVTSLATSSGTFSLFNTTATTINAFGDVTTLNIGAAGAAAALVTNFGGGTTAAEFRFLEPSAGGTSYSSFQAQAQAASITYTLPATVGGANTYLKDVAGNGVLSWATVAGGGDVSKVGTPANNQMAVWTGDGTLEGTSDFTYDGTSLNLITAKNFQMAGVTILADAAGTTTLSGIDALDATTEATVEAAIDTLANLTSIQGQTFTLSAGSFIRVGAHSFTMTSTGTTAVTFPTTGTLATIAGTEVLTGKTVNAEDAGNVITLPLSWVFLPAATQNGTASLGCSTGTSGAATASTTGTTIAVGMWSFVDASTAGCQFNFPLPTDINTSLAVEFLVKWRTSATTGNAVWQVRGVCAADAETIPTAYSTSPSEVIDAAKGTTLQLNDATLTVETAANKPLVTCASGEQWFIEIFRDPAHASDTIAATAEIVGLAWRYRAAK